MKCYDKKRKSYCWGVCLSAACTAAKIKLNNDIQTNSKKVKCSWKVVDFPLYEQIATEYIKKKMISSSVFLSFQLSFIFIFSLPVENKWNTVYSYTQNTDLQCIIYPTWRAQCFSVSWRFFYFFHSSLLQFSSTVSFTFKHFPMNCFFPYKLFIRRFSLIYFVIFSFFFCYFVRRTTFGIHSSFAL